MKVVLACGATLEGFQSRISVPTCRDCRAHFAETEAWQRNYEARNKRFLPLFGVAVFGLGGMLWNGVSWPGIVAYSIVGALIGLPIQLATRPKPPRMVEPGHLPWDVPPVYLSGNEKITNIEIRNETIARHFEELNRQILPQAKGH